MRPSRSLWQRQCSAAIPATTFDEFSNALRSFRSTPAVLDVVDRTISTLRADRLGLEAGDVHHISANRHPGEVLLWKPVVANLSGEAEGEEDWAADQERVLAQKIAQQIRQWIDDGVMLESRGRPVRAGDIMILVRRRSELARLIVARLYEEKVAVAGIDRLRLNAPLAVYQPHSAKLAFYALRCSCLAAC